MKTKLTFIILLASLTAALAQYQQPPPQISVSGSAEVKVAPDEIHLNVAVETRSETLEPARVENDDKIAAALAFLKQSGVPEKDVKTDFISVQPDYNYNQSHVKPVAYIVRKSIEIRLTRISDFQSVLTGLLTNGVNIVDGIDFRTTELRKYRDEARAMAIRAAKEKAKALTSELDVKLGKPINISANDGAVWGGWYQNRFNGYNAVQNQNVSLNGTPAADDGSDAFAAGQISVSANVNVSFLLE